MYMQSQDKIEFINTLSKLLAICIEQNEQNTQRKKYTDNEWIIYETINTNY
jgi:hypothetical protein